ncbi:MAG TPA: hypothetical protein VK550_34555 [Polyangiaceae bacterium]|jgi:hypothetical protein|nr:hypothetical protein [Polyangiaceae bacterium]
MLDPRAEAEAAFFTDSAQKVREARDTRRLIEDTISKSPYKNVAARVNCKDVLCEIDVTCPEISTCNDEILRLFGPQHQVQLGGAVIVPTREQLGDGRSRVVAYLARSGDLPF